MLMRISGTGTVLNVTSINENLVNIWVISENKYKERQSGQERVEESKLTLTIDKRNNASWWAQNALRLKGAKVEIQGVIKTVQKGEKTHTNYIVDTIDIVRFPKQWNETAPQQNAQQSVPKHAPQNQNQQSWGNAPAEQEPDYTDMPQ